MTPRRVYVAIMVASAKGKGLKLTAEEVAQMSMDDAVSTYATNCLTKDEMDMLGLTTLDKPTHQDWESIKS